MKSIKYGTILKAVIFNDTVETIMLVDNHTAGNNLNCIAVDLSSKQVLLECSSIREFVDNYGIKEIVGDFDDLFSI